MGFTDVFISNPATILTAALVLVTAVYAYHSMQQTKEMRATREQSNQPVVKGDVGLLGQVNLLAIVKNTGNGAAHSVSTKMFFEDIDVDPVTFKTPILSPEENYEFGFPQGGDKGFLTNMGQIESLIEEHDSDGILHFETTCENAFGEEYEYHDRIDVLDVKENLSQILYDDEMTKLRKGIEGIEKNVKKIRKNINQEYTDGLARMELYQQILEYGRSEGVVTFSKLKNELGAPHTETYNFVRQMKGSGVADYSDDSNPFNDGSVEITFF